MTGSGSSSACVNGLCRRPARNHLPARFRSSHGALSPIPFFDEDWFRTTPNCANTGDEEPKLTAQGVAAAGRERFLVGDASLRTWPLRWSTSPQLSHGTLAGHTNRAG